MPYQYTKPSVYLSYPQPNAIPVPETQKPSYRPTPYPMPYQYQTQRVRSYPLPNAIPA